MINPDMNAFVVQRHQEMTWQASPSKQVERKRFHLVGEPESGQVTSLVRYLPGASFPAHPHPDGEEILVLEGTFSDNQGDFPAGSYLLNPEGFSHAPFSNEGCLLFVKLRQYPGSVHLALPDVIDKDTVTLHTDDGVQTSIVHLPAGDELSMQPAGGVEGFVLKGTLNCNGEALGQYDWFRSPRDAKLSLSSKDCLVYLKKGAVSSLRTS